MKTKKGIFSWIGTGVFTIIGIVYILPILIVLMNSFKKKVYINKEPFQIPSGKTFASIENYISAIDKYELLSAVGWTVFITVGSVLVILVCTSMCAWYITRVTTKFTKLFYLLCVFSMVVPFQMVMFTLSLVADRTGLRTPWGIILIYLGFGAGLAVFMFCGFVKSIPLEIEEAAMIDGANAWKRLFHVTIPNMMPSITICTFLTITNSFKLFDQNLSLTGGEPLHKTEMLALNIYDTFYGRVGYEGVGQAKAVIFFLAVIVISMLQLRLTRSKEVQQ
jgi:raffinose/stachyose/melibiose transport system permease protein